MAHSPSPNPQSPQISPFPDTPQAETPEGHPSRLEVPEKALSRSNSITQYEFIMQTGEESAATAKQKLKRVRSHVMKNYLQQQQQQQQQQGQGLKKGESSLAAGSIERRKGKQRARSARSSSREDRQSPSSPALSGGRARSTSAEAAVILPDFSLSIPFSGVSYGGQIDFAQRQRFALDFGFVAPQDEVSAFAQQYLTFLVRDKKAGLLEPSFEALNAKGETMRIVQDTISVCGYEIPQSIIFAVALLAFGCGADREWDQARGHVEALQRLVDMRGGVQTVDFELQRILIWYINSWLAAALRLSPHFPLPLFQNTHNLTLALNDEAQIRAWRTVKRFPKNMSFVFDIVLRFHQLGFATSSSGYPEIDQRTLSNLYFETMHSAAAVQIDEPWTRTLPTGIQGEEVATMFKVWVTGLPVFIWATIRHSRNRLGIIIPRFNIEPVLSRVRAFLDSAGGYHAWPRGKSLEPVLATLFYCLEACDYGDPWRVWCLDTLRKASETLKLKTIEEFRKTLGYFPSTEEYEATADELWGEMAQQNLANTPSLTFSTIH